jgi:hypothetical protein
MARRLYPTWPSHSLEHVASRLNVANAAEHRTLPDARLVKDIFLEMLRRTPTVKTIVDLSRLSPMLAFADAPVFTAELPTGFKALATALARHCTMVMVYVRELQGLRPWKITPHIVLQVYGIAYVVGHYYQSGMEWKRPSGLSVFKSVGLSEIECLSQKKGR